ncbi:MAG: glycosyltransferase family 2 protein [Chloroflexi bacterium]|nr:glycosyltransferase family 2 protein [Chloroflexota bacterium]MCI0575259.1 glycosyltransferase family 2 protein [Chloroflexota bacterium]MCI0645705.1 glycosyltransferase family 2 protein [Chloroflexota bacterium]MCI0731236.1 glycosyltransferase family 2 protein [Chloroflexota bacterium]
MILALFWLALGLILYTYVVFPLLIFWRGLLAARPYHQAPAIPRASVIIAAYNEADSIRAKLENILSLDYPAERLEVIVASDGSRDGTNDIVRQYAGRGVKLLPLPRQGKAAALNAAVAIATGDILVFSDANSMYAHQALRFLVQPFADPRVGGVAGNQRYLSHTGSTSAGEGEKSYWGFDRQLKRFQSRAGNVISATGAIYAIRRELFLPVPEGVTDDFVTSTRVIAQGYRLVFAPEAVAYEPVAGTRGREFGRKVRVITRGLRAVLFMGQLLNPFRYGFYALQLFSHKLLRRLVVFPLLLLLVTSPLLWSYGLFYQLVTLAQLGFYGLAAAGMLLEGTRLGRVKFFSLPFYFCLVNLACLLAVWNVLQGRRIVLWETRRPEAGEAGVIAQPSERRAS